MWFLKWVNMYALIKRKELDSPHLIWQCSEMVSDPIINNKPLSDLLDFEERS